MSAPQTHIVFLGIGSNLGNRKAQLEQAIEGIGSTLGELENISGVYETAAWGITDQAAFLNQAIQITTQLLPQKLMQTILRLEAEMGRKRGIKWGPRTIDIDILFYANEIIHTAELQIPHPQLHLRNFVLVPLAEIAPTFVHPLFKKTIKQLLLECPDKLEAKPYKSK